MTRSTIVVMVMVAVVVIAVVKDSARQKRKLVNIGSQVSHLLSKYTSYLICTAFEIPNNIHLRHFGLLQRTSHFLKVTVMLLFWLCSSCSGYVQVVLATFKFYIA